MALINNKSNRIGYYFLFLLSPLLALIISIKNYKDQSARSIVFLILVLFGLTMVYTTKGLDAYGESQKFIEWANKPFSSIVDYYSNLYKMGDKVDFFQPLLMFLLSRLTNNPSIYYGVIAAIFAIFFLKSVNHIYDTYYDRTNQNALIFLAFFTTILPIFYISGSRWAIAAWVFFYSAYRIINQKEYKYFFLAGLASIIHFSFIAPFLLLIIFLLIGNRNSLYYLLILFSFVITPFLTNYLTQFESSSLIGVQDRVKIYTNEEVIQSRTSIYQTSAWYAVFQFESIYYYLIISIVIARQKYRRFSRDIIQEKIYSFCLLLFAFVNSVKDIPSGNRFRMIFFLFATLYLIILFSRTGSRRISPITIIGILPMLLYFLMEYRRGLETMNALLIAPLPFPLIFSYSLF